MTLELVKTAQEPRRLDRAKWHKPLVSVIVTHFDYSDHIEDALLSLLDQTHENWECVVVDDCSEPAHVLALEAIITKIASPKIQLVRLEENVGQIGAFFAGLSYTRGEFVCPLDPDDRYTPYFLEASLSAHLNPSLYCPVVCSGQYQLKNGEVLSGLTGPEFAEDFAVLDVDSWKYTPAEVVGWHWSTTSSLMLRRSALNHIRPFEPIITVGPEKRALDAYVAQGCHMLGGTIFIKAPLIYRGVHDSNSWIRSDLCSSRQSTKRDGAVGRHKKLIPYLAAAIRHNGGEHLLARAQKRPGLLAKWRRSFDKRWRWLTGAGQ